VMRAWLLGGREPTPTCTSASATYHLARTKHWHLAAPIRPIAANVCVLLVMVVCPKVHRDPHPPRTPPQVSAILKFGKVLRPAIGISLIGPAQVCIELVHPINLPRTPAVGAGNNKGSAHDPNSCQSGGGQDLAE
jgi:hypothetical protein